MHCEELRERMETLKEENSFRKLTFSKQPIPCVRTKDESLKKKKKKGFKSHIAQDKHLNIVSLPIYRECISSFFLTPVEKHFLNFLSPSPLPRHINK